MHNLLPWVAFLLFCVIPTILVFVLLEELYAERGQRARDRQRYGNHVRRHSRAYFTLQQELYVRTKDVKDWKEICALAEKEILDLRKGREALQRLYNELLRHRKKNGRFTKKP